MLRPKDNVIDFKNIGGGISIFIRNNISFKPRNDLNLVLPYIECSFIEVNFNNKKYLIAGIYRIPNSNINTFLEKFNDIIEPLKSNYELLLFGDYNIDLLKDDSATNNFYVCLQSNYLLPTIHAATRIATKSLINGEKKTSATLIDNIIIKANLRHHSGLIESSISDHYPIFITIPEIVKDDNEKDIPQTVQYRLINNHTLRKFLYALSQSNIQSILRYDSAQSAFTNFNLMFNELYEKHFPIKTKILSKKDIEKPWINEVLVKQLKIKDRLGKLASRNRINANIFKKFRNIVTSNIRKAKQKYFEKEFINHSDDIKKTWSLINSAIKTKNKDDTIQLNDDNGQKVDKNDVSNTFINYFTNIATKLTSELPVANNDAEYYLKNRMQNSFYFRETNAKEIQNIITNLKDNGKGIYKISNCVLDYCQEFLAPILSHIINLCTSEGYFPHELKYGCITPIFKAGEKELVNNYRPVCAVSPLSKIIEKVIHNRMIEFLDKHNLLSKTQFGFRKSMGTETALIDYINQIHQGLKNKHYIFSIFLDLSKAFDVMNHNILKTKLDHYGFRGKFLELLMDFVKDRQYYVSANGIKSNLKTVNIGVPQGSTLGPLLFLIYINDMINSSDIFHLTQFADDSTATYSDSNLNNALTIIEREFLKVIDWLTANKLIINLSKTHLMLFTNKKRPQTISINVKGTVINETSETKFLGII